MQPVYAVCEPTSCGLSGRGAACLCGVRTDLQGTVRLRCNLFFLVSEPTPPPKDCRAGVQPVYAVSEPTSRGLSARGVASLSGVPTYLPGIFVRVQPIYEVSVSTFRGLLGRDAACLCGVRTYLGMYFIPKPRQVFCLL